jgi:pimeloyl-ACP methyl ester carboxylesterase
MCPGFTVSLVNSFLEAVGAERSMVVGNSSGGLVALHLAFSEAARDLE